MPNIEKVSNALLRHIWEGHYILQCCRLHRCTGRGSGSKLPPLNVVLSPGTKATRAPDAIALATMQSFSSQFGGFLSLLLLKRCFEIQLPFEVFQVQHDIYLRYNPNCFLSRSHPLSLLSFSCKPRTPPTCEEHRNGPPSGPPGHSLAWREPVARGRPPGRPPRRQADTPARPEDPVWRGGAGGGRRRRPWRGGQLLTNPAALSRNPTACQSPLASDRGLAPVQTLACKQASRLALWSIS